MKRNLIVIFLYLRLFDPLIQSIFWPLIEKVLREDGNYKFHVISYEYSGAQLSAEQADKINEWRRLGVEWTPLTYHPGKNLLLKAIDLVTGFWKLFRLRRQGYRHLITYGSIAGAFGYLNGLLLGMNLFLYSFEPHSEYLRDCGLLSNDSLKFKILHNLELKAARFAKVIASGTVFMADYLAKQVRSSAIFFKIPSVTDSDKFSFNADHRAAVRSELGLADDARLLYYSGKFGGLYYESEFARMYRCLLDMEPNLHLLIVSPDSNEYIFDLFDRENVPRSRYFIRHSTFDEIHRFASAADFGIVAVPPGASKRFVSNIKVGEYLCSGLPFLITRGVSEDYLYAEQKRVGVVVNDFSDAEIRNAWPTIRDYLAEDKYMLRAHCRSIGIQYRGLNNLWPIFQSALYALIGGNEIRQRSA